MEIRLMTIDDYDMVYSLWTSDKAWMIPERVSKSF